MPHNAVKRNAAASASPSGAGAGGPNHDAGRVYPVETSFVRSHKGDCWTPASTHAHEVAAEAPPSQTPSHKSRNNKSLGYGMVGGSTTATSSSAYSFPSSPRSTAAAAVPAPSTPRGTATAAVVSLLSSPSTSVPIPRRPATTRTDTAAERAVFSSSAPSQHRRLEQLYIQPPAVPLPLDDDDITCTPVPSAANKKSAMVPLPPVPSSIARGTASARNHSYDYRAYNHVPVRGLVNGGVEHTSYPTAASPVSATASPSPTRGAGRSPRHHARGAAPAQNAAALDSSVTSSTGPTLSSSGGGNGRRAHSAATGATAAVVGSPRIGGRYISAEEKQALDHHQRFAAQQRQQQQRALATDIAALDAFEAAVVRKQLEEERQRQAAVAAQQQQQSDADISPVARSRRSSVARTASVIASIPSFSGTGAGAYAQRPFAQSPSEARRTLDSPRHQSLSTGSIAAPPLPRPDGTLPATPEQAAAAVGNAIAGASLADLFRVYMLLVCGVGRRGEDGAIVHLDTVPALGPTASSTSTSAGGNAGGKGPSTTDVLWTMAATTRKAAPERVEEPPSLMALLGDVCAVKIGTLSATHRAALATAAAAAAAHQGMSGGGSQRKASAPAKRPDGASSGTGAGIVCVTPAPLPLLDLDLDAFVALISVCRALFGDVPGLAAASESSNSLTLEGLTHGGGGGMAANAALAPVGGYFAGRRRPDAHPTATAKAAATNGRRGSSHNSYETALSVGAAAHGYVSPVASALESVTAQLHEAQRMAEEQQARVAEGLQPAPSTLRKKKVALMISESEVVLPAAATPRSSNNNASQQQRGGSNGGAEGEGLYSERRRAGDDPLSIHSSPVGSPTHSAIKSSLKAPLPAPNHSNPPSNNIIALQDMPGSFDGDDSPFSGSRNAPSDHNKAPPSDDEPGSPFAATNDAFPFSPSGPGGEEDNDASSRGNSWLAARAQEKLEAELEEQRRWLKERCFVPLGTESVAVVRGIASLSQALPVVTLLHRVGRARARAQVSRRVDFFVEMFLPRRDWPKGCLGTPANPLADSAGAQSPSPGNARRRSVTSGTSAAFSPPAPRGRLGSLPPDDGPAGPKSKTIVSAMSSAQKEAVSHELLGSVPANIFTAGFIEGFVQRYLLPLHREAADATTRRSAQQSSVVAFFFGTQQQPSTVGGSSGSAIPAPPPGTTATATTAGRRKTSDAPDATGSPPQGPSRRSVAPQDPNTSLGGGGGGGTASPSSTDALAPAAINAWLRLATDVLRPLEELVRAKYATMATPPTATTTTTTSSPTTASAARGTTGGPVPAPARSVDEILAPHPPAMRTLLLASVGPFELMCQGLVRTISTAAAARTLQAAMRANVMRFRSADSNDAAVAFATAAIATPAGSTPASRSSALLGGAAGGGANISAVFDPTGVVAAAASAASSTKKKSALSAFLNPFQLAFEADHEASLSMTNRHELVMLGSDGDSGSDMDLPQDDEDPEALHEAMCVTAAASPPNHRGAHNKPPHHHQAQPQGHGHGQGQAPSSGHQRRMPLLPIRTLTEESAKAICFTVPAILHFFETNPHW